MQIPLISLTTFLSCMIFASSAIIPQVPLDYARASEAKYGYSDPGVYRIVSVSNSYAVSLNDSSSTSDVVSMYAACPVLKTIFSTISER